MKKRLVRDKKEFRANFEHIIIQLENKLEMCENIETKLKQQV